MYPSTAAADRYARGTISPNPERNGPPLRSRGGLEKIISNFRRVAYFYYNALIYSQISFQLYYIEHYAAAIF